MDVFGEDEVKLAMENTLKIAANNTYDDDYDDYVGDV